MPLAFYRRLFPFIMAAFSNKSKKIIDIICRVVFYTIIILFVAVISVVASFVFLSKGADVIDTTIKESASNQYEAKSYGKLKTVEVNKDIDTIHRTIPPLLIPDHLDSSIVKKPETKIKKRLRSFSDKRNKYLNKHGAKK